MSYTPKYFYKGIELRPTTDETNLTEGCILVNSSTNKMRAYLNGALHDVVTVDQTQTLTNKTIDASGNTIINLTLANLASGILDTDLTSVSASHDTIPSAKAVKDYVDTVASQHDDASEINYNNTTSGLAATKVQGAIDEVEARVDSVESVNTTQNSRLTAVEGSSTTNASNLSTHIANTSTHGVSGAIVGTTDAQTLTNKTITGASLQTPIRSDVKQDTRANLTTYANTAANGQIVYATDTKEYLAVKDNVLVDLGGGTGSLSAIFQLKADELINNWQTGNNSTFLGGGALSGTFAKETSTPLHGLSSYKYTQAAGSLNDYFASPAQAIDLRFRGQQTFLSFVYQYNGNTNDIQIIIYDATNSAILNTTDYVVGTNGSTSNAIVGVTIPLTCTSIRVGFQVKVLNNSKLFSFDDIQLGLDLYNTTNLSNTSFLRFEGCSSRGSTDTFICKFDTQTIYSGTDFSITNTTANGTIIQMLTSGTVSIESTISTSAALFWITKNQANLTANPLASESMGIQTSGASIVREQVTSTFDVVIGDKIRIASNVTPTADTWSNFILSFKSQSSAIVTPTQQVSSDTMNFAFKSTAIDSNVDAIGTFNTYTYAANGNTATIATSAPTQTTSSMNVNGIQVFGRAFGSASTSANPSRVDIFIGKGLKSKQVDFYAASAKSTAIGSDNVIVPVNLDERGIHQSYDETTGILSIDVGIVEQGTGYQRYLWNYKNNSSVTSPYFVFNASKAPSITALPILQTRIATITDQKSSGTNGGSASAGVYQTKTLNTIVDSTGIVTSLASNQFTLPAGTYYIEASSPACAVDRHRCRVRNITDAVTSVLGDSQIMSGGTTMSTSVAKGEIVISSSKVFEVQHYTQTARATDGFGINAGSGENEVYTTVKITKIK